MRHLLIALPALLLLVRADVAQLHDVVRCVPDAVITLPGGVTTAAAFSPDGTLLATGGAAGDLMLLDVRTGAVHWQCWPGGLLGTIAFSPDGRRIAATGAHLTVHDVATGVELAHRRNTGPHTVCWSTDGRLMAYAEGDSVQLVETEHYEFAHPRLEFTYPIHAMVFAADDQTLFVGDNVGQIWRAAPSGQVPRERLFKHGNDQRCARLGRAAGGFVSFSNKGELRRDGRTTRLDRELCAVALSADGEHFVAGDGEGNVVWASANDTWQRELHLSAAVSAAALDTEHSALFVATQSGDNLLYRGDAAPVELPGHNAIAGEIAVSPDGTALAVCSRGPYWSAPNGSGYLVSLDGLPPQRLADCAAVGTGRSGAELVVLGKDNLRIVDGRTGNSVVTATREAPWSWHTPSVDVAANGQLLLGRLGGQLFDPATGEFTRAPEPLYSQKWIDDTALATDGRWAVGATSGVEGEDGLLLVTDAAGRELFREAGRSVDTVDFSPDGRRLFYAFTTAELFGLRSPQNTVRIRDAVTFALLHEATAPIRWWRYLDERYAIALGRDGLQVWDADRLVPVQTIDVGLPVQQVRLCADRRTLVVSTGRDVRTFRLSRL
ncbi:MAG: WD40 repeat domain-containing protein [Planctomycetes bacterium]|nr:WD40 repeat domain-containing protein [Planctomycetota bacterium]MCB9885882.1 WD40 repeat domain-containing protein [Planctomycetota bacterium]